MRLGVLAVLVCSVVVRSAIADPIPESEMWETRSVGQRDGSHTADARPTTMPWCSGKFTAQPWAIPKFKEAMREHEDFTAWADAAEHLCQHREDPTWIKQATYLVQQWMNANNLVQADAEKEIREKIASLKLERSPAGQATAEEQKFAFTESDITVVKPEPGVAEAKVTSAPAWCNVVGKFAPDDRWQPGRINRTVDSRYGIKGTLEGALHVCQRPNDTTWKQAAGYILQKWMNWTHLSQADAETSIRARIQTAKFEAERTALCKALEVSPELAGKEKTYADAKRQLFGCTNNDQLLWQDVTGINTGGVMFYLDSEPHPDELMRVYWLFGYVPDPGHKTLPATDASDNLPLLYYAVAQDDLAKVDPAALDKLVSAPPYNEYARIAMMETVAAIKARQRDYEQAVAKMTKGDADYTAILRAAPKKASAQWDQLVAQWKPELARSNAFEDKFSAPSRKALRGCSTELAKDAEKVISSFKTKVYKELVDKIASDPAANVLLRRVSWCFAVDKVWGGSGALRDLVQKGRNLRGPRSIAYYAIVDAIADAQKDRPRLLLGLSNFFPNGGVLSGETNFDERALDFSGHLSAEWEKSDDQGVVASVKKGPDGVQITFKKVISRYPDSDCVDDVRHPMKINGDGRIEYYQNCKPNGKTIVQDNTPRSIVISPLLASGVKPGVFLRFVDAGSSANNGTALGQVMFTKTTANDKTITSFLGFAL